MNYPLLLARRIVGTSKGGGQGQSSRAIVRIAVIGIAIGVAVMLLSTAIVTGFQREIKDKVIGFGAHLQVTYYNPQNTLGTKPMDREQPFLADLKNDESVRHIQPIAYKSGIITANGEIQGIVAKGIDSTFDWSFFQKNMVEGKAFDATAKKKNDSIVLSQYICDRLKLTLGDKITVVFIQDQKERKRRFVIGGIYSSGMEQFDASILLCDIRHVQRLNGWDTNQVAGFEVFVNKFDDLDKLDAIIRDYIGYEFNTIKISDQHQDIFGWLELQDINVYIIIILMILVSGINMISALLVLILERTNMIGILKALGSKTRSIRAVFLYNAAYLILIGLFWGNVFALLLGWTQIEWRWIKLDKASYYVDAVPILFDFSSLILINAGSLILCLAMLLLPSMLISKMDPVKSIRFN